MPAMLYGPVALDDLRRRTEYESWLLEAIYDIVDQSLAFKALDQLIYPPGGARPIHAIHGIANINLGDWRPGFLAVGAPLVFVTDFKLLDMLMEWILVENGQTSTHRFEQKIAALKGSVCFPPLLDARPWLCERLIALYNNLEPLRGTVIHARYFRTQNGSLEVSSSKGGTIGPAVTLAPTDLRNLSLVLISLLRYLEGAWIMDVFGEKRIRRVLDELAHVHHLPSLGQLPPILMNARVYVPDEELIHYDTTSIYDDIAKNYQKQDVIFNLRIVAISRDGTHATAYLIPWEQLKAWGLEIQRKRVELAPYTATMPPDIDIVEIARAMK